MSCNCMRFNNSRSNRWQRQQFQLKRWGRMISGYHNESVQRNSLPSWSFASSLLLIAVGRVGAGGVFNLGMVREAEDELKD